MTEFAEHRSRLMEVARLNSSRDLLMMKNNIEYYLLETGVVVSCQTEATGNPSCMLYVSGESPAAVEIVAARLDTAFNEHIRFGGETTYRLECSEDTVVLEFATCASASLLVTGCMAITCLG